MSPAQKLLGERRELREQLERSLAEYPDNGEEHARHMRLLAWNRHELQSARKRGKVKQ